MILGTTERFLLVPGDEALPSSGSGPATFLDGLLALNALESVDKNLANEKVVQPRPHVGDVLI